MPRIRNIKPQFWLDEGLGSIKRDARLLYIGLWNLSDDRGVFEWRPSKIRIQIFPYDTDIKDKTIEDLLCLLVGINDILKFEENGKSFGYIPTFEEHQDIKNPSKWTFTTTLPDTNTTPVLPHSYPSTNEEKLGEPLGSRSIVIGSRSKGIGDRVQKQPYGEFNNVLLSDEEYKKLTDRFNSECPERIERLSTYLASKGVKYKSHYAVILSWALKDKQGGQTNGTHQQISRTVPGQEPGGAFEGLE